MSRCRGKARTVGAEGRAEHTIGVSKKLGDQRAGLRVPDTRAAVIRRRDNTLSIRTEDGAADPILVPGKRQQACAGLAVPNSRSLVGRRSDYAQSIRAE